MYITINTLVCGDCAVLISYDDDSHMMPTDADRVRSVIAALPYHVIVDGSGYYEFDSRPCGICDTTRPATRYDAELINR